MAVKTTLPVNLARVADGREEKYQCTEQAVIHLAPTLGKKQLETATKRHAGEMFGQIGYNNVI